MHRNAGCVCVRACTRTSASVRVKAQLADLIFTQPVLIYRRRRTTDRSLTLKKHEFQHVSIARLLWFADGLTSFPVPATEAAERSG